MMPVLGRPITAWIIADLVQVRVRNFIIIANPSDSELMAYFQNNPFPSSAFQFVHQPNRLGMANALQCAAQFIRNSFFLSACDNLAPDGSVNEMAALWEAAPPASAILTLLKIDPINEPLLYDEIIAKEDGRRWWTQVSIWDNPYLSKESVDNFVSKMDDLNSRPDIEERSSD